MTVNPKKLRPYDQPPRRRRSLIPTAPGTAATGFLVAAALWLVVATVLGLLALGLRIVTFEFTFPLLLGLEFELNERRVDYAFLNATAFGWLSNAGFAAVAFMTPRLIGRPVLTEAGLNLGLVIWNLAVAGGIGALYVFELGPHAPLTAFPWFVMGGLATGAFIVTAIFVGTAATSLRSAYVSTWFAGIALLSLLGLTSLAAGLDVLETFFGLDALPTALASVFIERAISVLWLLGMVYATLHYVVPQAAGQPLYSGGLGLLTWLTWLLLAPVAALGVLLDASVPFFVTTIGAVATMLLLVPAALALANLSLTMQGRWTLLFGTGAAAFAMVSLVFLLAVSMLEAIGALRAVRVFVGGTDWETGLFVWAAYGAFGFAALALAEHGLPRLLKRAWGGGIMSSAALWLAFGGVTIAGLALMGGGMAQASLMAQGVAPDAMGEQLLVYRAAGLAGFGLVALAGLAHLGDQFLMYTSAEPIEYATPDRSAPAAAGH